ncbi:hypothetical protein [Larkinella soli]|uniref:hypothetical protein n=1 Tax=Larkinella soli TaxID=1770527 RepID=UPI000FFBBEE6|nr:hypothetical protein [Larkinella soli]
MDKEEIAWHIARIRHEYQALRLNNRQAELLLAFQQIEIDEEADSGTFWESISAEVNFLTTILKKDQLNRLKKFHFESQLNQIEQLKNEDQQFLALLKFETDNLAYVTETILPTLKNNPLLYRNHSEPVQTKLGSVRLEYEQQLKIVEKDLIRFHSRHSLTYQPNKLKADLTRHKVNFILPNSRFLSRKDQVLQEAIEALKIDLSGYIEEVYSSIKFVLSEWEAVQSGLLATYYSKAEPPSSIYISQATESEIRHEKEVMMLLLLPEGYLSSPFNNSPIS